MSLPAPAVLALACVEAPHAARQEDAKNAALALFETAPFDLGELGAVFDRAGIARRTFAMPLAEYRNGPAAGAAQATFRRVAEDLLAQAARRVLPPAVARRVTHVVTICTTGVATPSLECAVMQTVGVDLGARRIPVFGLGCAGGVAGLQIARDLASSSPDALVLLLAVELTSLTLLRQDLSRQNFVACALFGDGAAACLVGRPRAELPGLLELGRGATRLFPRTPDLMGWEVRDDGWRVIFSPRIPAVVRAHAREIFGAVCDPARVRHFVLHPGGRKILEAYEQGLDLAPRALDHAAGVLRDHGNMSSVTVFFVLERALCDADPRAGDAAVLSAFGPGFSAEVLAATVLAGAGARAVTVGEGS
jgi:alkylresorcinol/alkylpyrone synthase